MIDPGGSGYSAAIVGTTFLPIVWLAIIIRCLVRWFLTTIRFGLDDLFCVLAGVAFTLQAISAIGLNQRNEAPIEVAITRIKWVQTIAIAYSFGCLFIKLSLAIAFLRLLTKKLERQLCWSLMIFSTVVNLETGLYTLFHCGRPSKQPERILQGKCKQQGTDVIAHIYVQAVINLLYDLIVTCLPLLVVYRAGFDWKKKTTVAFVLVLAGGGTICSTVRLSFVHELASPQFEHAVEFTILSLLDIGLFIILGCFGASRPLLTRLFPSTATSFGPKLLQHQPREVTEMAAIVSKPNGTHGLNTQRGSSTATTV